MDELENKIKQNSAEKISEYSEDNFLENYRKKTIEHWWSVYPAIIDSLNAKNKKILDVGCGNGGLTNAIAKLGAEKIIGVDISKKWVEFCKKEYSSMNNTDFYVADAGNLEMVKNESLDYALLNFVLLHIAEKEKIQKIFSEINRVLKKGGEFIMSEVHPSALMANSPIRETTNFLYKDGSRYKTKIRLIDGQWIEFSNVNWTLETLSELLQESELTIQKISEPRYINDAQEIFKNIKIPQYIIFHCKKLNQ